MTSAMHGLMSAIGADHAPYEPVSEDQWIMEDGFFGDIMALRVVLDHLAGEGVDVSAYDQIGTDIIADNNGTRDVELLLRKLAHDENVTAAIRALEEAHAD